MTRLVRFSNNAVSRLAANITNFATTLTVTPGDGVKFPTLGTNEYFMATLVTASGTVEIVKVTARSTDTFTVVRAAEPVAGVSTASAFSAGDKIELRLTSGAISSELDRLDSIALTGATNKTSAYTITAADISTLVRVSTAAGNVTITLPQISTLTDDFDVLVAKITSDANIVAVARAGTDLINGATTFNLTGQWQGAWLIADRSTSTWTVISSGAGSAVNTVVNSYTGSGTSGPFTLSGDPGSKNNTAVFVGGVYQQKSTYTLSGTSLTLGGTVASGVSVEVVWSAPLTVGTPSDGTVTTAKLADAAVTTQKMVDKNVTRAKAADDLLGVAQNAQSANYTLALTDIGGHVYSANTGAQTVTIPTNASIAFPVGSAISLVNNGTTAITISTTGITLKQAGTTNTGNRTLGVNGLATLLKVGTDTWFISGAGLT